MDASKSEKSGKVSGKVFEMYKKAFLKISQAALGREKPHMGEKDISFYSLSPTEAISRLSESEHFNQDPKNNRECQKNILCCIREIGFKYPILGFGSVLNPNGKRRRKTQITSTSITEKTDFFELRSA